MYKLVYTEPALKDLAGLDKQVAKRIVDKLMFFSSQTEVKSFSKALTGFPGRFRLRIGTYRVIFRVDSSGEIQILMVLRIKHRKDIYDL